MTDFEEPGPMPKQGDFVLYDPETDLFLFCVDLNIGFKWSDIPCNYGQVVIDDIRKTLRGELEDMAHLDAVQSVKDCFANVGEVLILDCDVIDLAVKPKFGDYDVFYNGFEVIYDDD